VHIPASIASEEVLVRGIFRPLFYSSKKLKPLAFMPARDKADVSLLRLSYTNADFCKQHTSTIQVNDSEYSGLAVIVAKAVAEANLIVAEKDLSVAVLSTPLRVDKSVRDIAEEIMSDDEGLPMHADLVYSKPVKRGEANAEIQLAARHLLAQAVYYADPDIPNANWKGPELLPISSGQAA
jgi:hypothetical protein